MDRAVNSLPPVLLAKDSIRFCALADQLLPKRCPESKKIG